MAQEHRFLLQAGRPDISLHLSETLSGVLFFRVSSPLVSRKGNLQEIKSHSIGNTI